MKKNEPFGDLFCHALKKTLLVMRIVVFIMFVSIFQIYANDSYSQKAKLSIKFSNARLVEVLDQIEAQSEFYFLYNEKLVDTDRIVTIDVNNQSISEILKTLFSGSDVEYNIVDRKIVLAPSSIKAELPVNNNVLVKGVVKDAEGMPVPGVSVVVKGTTTGTITDINGHYSINVPGKTTVLTFSFVGMRTLEVEVGDKQVIDVTLAAEDRQIDEVVVTALGMKRDAKALGYKVSQVGGESLTETPNGNVLNALEGKVSGVKISQMDGTTGSSVNMIIRGQKSLTGDNQPLFVIDGVPVKNQLNNFFEGADLGNAISDLNTDDVESISVLKGASAAALYGSRAGNGVVLITTKSGKNRKGIGVSFSTANSFEMPYHYVPFQTKFSSGKAGAHIFEEVENESWGAPLDAGQNWVQWNSNGKAVPLVSYPNRLKDFFQTGFSTTNNVAVDGNYDKGFFRLSVGKMDNTGIIPNTNLFRTSINLNTGYNVTKNLSVTANINWTETGSDNRPSVNGDDRGDIVRSLYEMGAQVNVLDLRDYWIKGQEGLNQLRCKSKQNNPYFLAYENTNAFSRDRLMSKLQFDWNLTKELKLTGKFTRDAYIQNSESKKGFSTYGQTTGGYDLSDNYSKEINMDLTLNYNKKFNKDWSVNAFVAGNRMYGYGRNILNLAQQLVIPTLYTISNGVPGTVTYRSSWSKKEIRSVYGMASLGYKDQVYLDLTARNDWSSTLPSDNRSYFYPSASLSLLVSQMVKLPEWISFAKLRAGIAEVGNDTSPYSLTQPFSIGDDWGSLKQLYMSGTLKNATLLPEIATSKEIGGDFKFLNNRVEFDVTYYNIENKNQILGTTLPIESGASNKLINAGLIESRGWEIGLNMNLEKTKDFSFDLNFNFSRNRTILKKLAEGMTNYSWGEFSGIFVKTYEGGTIGDLYMKPLLRVTDTSSPYYNYPLLTADGKYQSDTDVNHQIKVGNSNPDFTLGIQPSFKYKSFTLYANFDWSQGGEFYSITRMFFNNNGWSEDSFSGAAYNKSSDIVSQIKANPDAYFGHWVGGRTGEYGGFAWPAGKGTGRVQDASFNVGVRQVVVNGAKQYVENLGGSDTFWLDPFNANQNANRNTAPNKFIYDATYVKLRELALTYRLPQKFNEKLHLHGSSISFVATNVWEWTAAKTDIDPERAFKPNGASTNGGNIGSWTQGVEYYNAMPWTRTLGMKLNVDF